MDIAQGMTQGNQLSFHPGELRIKFHVCDGAIIPVRNSDCEVLLADLRFLERERYIYEVLGLEEAALAW